MFKKRKLFFCNLWAGLSKKAAPAGPGPSPGQRGGFYCACATIETTPSFLNPRVGDRERGTLFLNNNYSLSPL